MNPGTPFGLPHSADPIRRAVVTGATGCLGRALIRDLISMGASVSALVRNVRAAEAIDGFGNVRLIPGDMHDVTPLRPALQDADTVFHAAAYVHSAPRTEAERGTLYQVNVEGTRRLAEEARAHGVRAFVLFSTIGVYGREHREALTEDTLPRPETDYAKSKLQAEELVFSMLKGSDARATALRFCMVYGEGDRGNMKRLVRSVERGNYIAVDGGRARKNLLYARDAARAAIMAAIDPLSDQQTFVVSDPVAYSMREIVDTIARELHRPPSRMSLPPWVLRVLGGAADISRSVGIKTPFSSADVRTLMSDIVCDPSKIRQTLGFEPAFKLSQGLRQCIDSYLTNDK